MGKGMFQGRRTRICSEIYTREDPKIDTGKARYLGDLAEHEDGFCIEPYGENGLWRVSWTKMTWVYS